MGYRDVVVEADKPVVQKISYQSGEVFEVVPWARRHSVTVD